VRVRRWLFAALVVAVAPTLRAPSPVDAAAEGWSPLQEAGGSTLAVALDDRTAALVSVGGPDVATIYDQRRTAAGTVGPATEIMSVSDARQCAPVEAVTALGNVAVAVECQADTGLEDPPTKLVELVWTGDDGWVWRVQPEGELGSLDYSAHGQYVVFTSNSQYGRPHHVTSYHADLGWRDLTRREHGVNGDDMVAAVTDAGNVVALSGAGFEDEPGYWFGGRLRIETYDASAGRWSQRFTRSYPDGGIDPQGIDTADGRIMATVVQSRSTGQVHGPGRQGRRPLRPGEPPAVLVVTHLEPPGPHRVRGGHPVGCRRRRLAGGRRPAYRQALVRDLGAWPRAAGRARPELADHPD
jgi:hypothetical protein